MVQTALAPHAETPRSPTHTGWRRRLITSWRLWRGSRSTWQMWHVRAEAQRQVRAVDMAAEQAAALVDLLVDEVLDRRSVALVAPHDDIEEPDVLRRVDGSSVYTVAGTDLYTSQRILAAEQRLVAAAGLDGGSGRRPQVDVALLEAANGTVLNSGQVAMVRAMALRCPVAARDRPGRAGKTTAMRTLAEAWATPAAGIGLAPSAAAAAGLAEQTGTRADTVAKLVWSIDPRAAGLGGADRAFHVGDHRRGRHGRHLVA